MNKRDLSERDICSKFIGPAIKRAGWDGMMQIREEVAFTKGRIIETKIAQGRYLEALGLASSTVH